MANIIALIIFIASFIGLGFLVFRKISVLASLPEQAEQVLETSQPIKHNLLQKTTQIGQAVLHSRGVGVVGVAMVKTGGRFKTIFANRIITHTQEEIEKVEKIHQEGDYWQKVETHKFPLIKKIRIRKKKAE
ncbi:MAG: hypothetical protein V1819_00985 [bacterium]